MDIAPDEYIPLIGGCVLGFLLFASWYGSLMAVRSPLARVNPLRGLMYLVPLLMSAILFVVMVRYASVDVRTNAIYIFMYFALGLGWVCAALWLFPYFGLTMRDDVTERANPGAAYAIAGGAIGLTLCYAGGNIGEGPSWVVVVICASLSTLGFFALWYVLNLVTNITENITIGRDTATGIRLGAFFIAAGLLLGRAVAGDWFSFALTILDFVKVGWVVLIVLAIALVFEFVARPTKDEPIRPMLMGILPGVLYIAAAFVLIAVFPANILSMGR